MTEAETEEHKEKMKKVMIHHLTELGFPKKMTKEQIMAEVPDMWRKLEEAGLILDGMTYKMFLGHADRQYAMAVMDDIMGV